MQIIALLVIAAAVAVLISMAGEFSQYTDFSAALEAPEQNHQIVGHLSLGSGKEVVYNPKEDPNVFYFYMKDRQGMEKKVKCLQEKPNHFERSEQIVLTGRMQGELFVAHDIQMKCPSKYQDNAAM